MADEPRHGLMLPNGTVYPIRPGEILAPPDESDDSSKLRDLLKLPSDYPCRRTVFTSDGIPQLDGFVGYMLGFPALWDWSQGEPPVPWGPHEDADLTLFPILRLRLTDCLLAIERRWPPAPGPAISVHGADDLRATPAQFARLGEARVLLEPLDQLSYDVTLAWDGPIVTARRAGRKQGSGAKWPGGIHGGGLTFFLDDLFTTLEKLQSSTGKGKHWGIDPTSHFFRARMRVYSAERTLRTWLEAAHLAPDDIKTGAVNRLNYRQFVAERGG